MTKTKDQFICFLEPTRAGMPDDPTPEEAAAVSAHFAYYTGLHTNRTLVLAGRTLEPPHVGTLIFEAADAAQAQSIVDADPAITAGVFTARVQPYRVALIAKKTQQWAPGIAAPAQPLPATNEHRSPVRITLLFLWLISLAQVVQTLFWFFMSVYAWETFGNDGLWAIDAIRISELVLWTGVTVGILVLWLLSLRKDPRPRIWGVVVSLSLMLVLFFAFTIAWVVNSLSML